MTTDLAAVARATTARATAHEGFEQADDAWRTAIRRAIDAGHSLGEVASVASVTRGRIQQIRDHRR